MLFTLLINPFLHSELHISINLRICKYKIFMWKNIYGMFAKPVFLTPKNLSTTLLVLPTSNLQYLHIQRIDDRIDLQFKMNVFFHPAGYEITGMNYSRMIPPSKFGPDCL